MSTDSTVYEVKAFNYAFDSDNKIHSDDIAAQYGFQGGLVPGVADFAYLARAVFEHWGEPWLQGGTLEGKLIKPIYHDELARAEAQPGEVDGALVLSLRNHAGEMCAAGTATLAGAGQAPRPQDYPQLDPPAEDARAAPAIAAFPAGTLLGEYGYRYDHRASMTEAEQMFVDSWPGKAKWHPAIALHDANRILRANVALGPWIHTASRLELFGAPSDGDTISLRGRVKDTFERRGHIMTTTDLALFASERPIARIEHSAIIRLADAR